MSTFRKVRALLWGARLVFRFISGRPMSGERKTDATFWRPATRSLDPSGDALRWEMMRGASRAAWRLAGVYVLLLLPAYGVLRLIDSFRPLPWYSSPGMLLWGNVSVFCGACSAYLLRKYAKEYGWWKVELLPPSITRTEGARAWRREKVLPIARSMSVILGHSIPERKATEWVYVPKGYRDGAPVSIMLPPHFTGADAGVQKRLVASVGAKLGVKGMLPDWQTEGASPRLLLRAPALPPTRVEYSDVKEWLLNSEEYRPFLGLAGGSTPFYAEMIADSPHVGLSAGPGAGKSTMAKAVIAQALSWGWGVIVIDWKRSDAFSWLGGLEGVTYLSDIGQIHDMGVRLAEEVDLRKNEGMAGKAKVLVVRDEWNVTAPLLYDYWSTLRSTAEPEEKRSMPLRSPALSGFAVLDFAGREYGMFDFCIAQKFSARIFNGNADIRECFGIKLMARYSPQTVKMLAPDIKPFPRKDNTEGRWVAVVGDEATVLQGVYLTSAEARELACSGLPNPLFPLGTQRTQGSSFNHTQGDRLRPDATPSPGASSGVNLPPRGRKLSALVEGLEPLGITLNVLRNATRSDGKGDPAFPAPVSGDPVSGYRYEFEAVKEWARRRHAAKEATK